MYLSTLLIDVGTNPDRPRPGRLWLRNLYHVHQRLCMAFPSESRSTDDADFLKPFTPDDFGQGQVHVRRNSAAGFLFRIDPQSGNRVVILVQSTTRPNWDYAFHNADYLLAARPDIGLYNPSFVNGQTLRFRLKANPTRKIDTKTGPDGRRNNGRRVPVPTDRLYDWLVERAGPAGFSIDENSVSIQPGYIYMNKPTEERPARLRSVRFDGLLRITDADAFRETLAKGIGPGKAFGFGMLSVAPCGPSPPEEKK